MRSLPPGLPHATRALIGCSAGEAAALSGFDLRLARLGGDCARLEAEILEQRPESGREAVAKLQLLTACLIDGQELELGHFAYLVAECADVLERLG